MQMQQAPNTTLLHQLIMTLTVVVKTVLQVKSVLQVVPTSLVEPECREEWSSFNNSNCVHPQQQTTKTDNLPYWQKIGVH